MCMYVCECINVCFCSVAKSSPALCNPWTAVFQASLSFDYLLELAQTHVHWVSDAIQPFQLCPLLLLLPSIFPSSRGFSNESALHIRYPKYWSFSFSISPCSEYSGLISLLSKGLSRVFSSTTVQKLQFFGALPSLCSSSHNCMWLLERP